MKKIFFLITICINLLSFNAIAQHTLPSSESFESDFGIWIQNNDDNLDWTRWQDTTPTSETGPSGAYDGNYYIYIESDPDNYNPARHADLIGKFYLTGTNYPILSFYYNMYGDFINYLEVKISTDSTNWTDLTTIIGNQGPLWHRQIICLNDYANTDSVYILFRGWTSGDNDTNAVKADIALDLIQIVDFKFVDTTITDVTCGGYSDGSINVAIQGGFKPFEYTIDGTNFTTPSNDTNHLFSGLSGGAYFTKVRSAGACVMSAGYLTVDEPPKPDIAVDTQYIKPCEYSQNGEIHISVTGGDAPLSYSITGPSGTFVSSPDFTGLDSGLYHVAVKDGKDCIYDEGEYKIEPLYKIIITSLDVQDVNTCYGDSTGYINIEATGGYKNLTYSIDTGNTYEINGYFPNLPADTYIIFIKDLNGCIDTTDEIIINQPTKVTINNITKQDVNTCYGDSTGYIDINASGGTGLLKYSINGGNSYYYTHLFDSLPAGEYHIIVSDSNNCTDGPDTITLTQPPLLVIDSVKYNDVTGCYGDSTGSIEIFAQGGTPTLQYSIDNGQNFQLLNLFSDLPAGTYYPYVKDGANCIVTAPQITINQPSKVKITNIATTNIQNCYGDSTGQIIIYAAGGTGTLSYSIDTGTTLQASNLFDSLPAGNYRAYVQDDNGCSDTGETIILTQPQQIVITDQAAGDARCFQTQTGWIYVNAFGGTGSLLFSIDSGSVFNHTINDTISVYAGNYYIAVQDENGCTVFGSALNVNEPPELSIDSIVVQNVNTCYGDSTGKITFYVTGGTPPYLYSIDGGATLSSSNVFDSLPSGTNYYPYVIDANNCIKTYSNISIGQPTSISFSDVSKRDIDTCHGVPIGEISIQVTGGTPPYTYSVDSGQNFVANSTFNNLYAGTYYITVKDDHNCQAWYTVPIEILQPDTLIFDSIVYKNISCNGLQDGSIRVYNQGGKIPYTYILYDLDRNDTTSLSTPYFTSLKPANYLVRVKDYYNCQIDTQITITEPPALILDSVTYEDVQTCYGDSTGIIRIYAHGGTSPIQYAYAHIGGNITNYYDNNIFNNVPAGSYYTGVRDAKGCIQTSTAFTISQPSPITIRGYQSTPITCAGDNDATILIDAIGGTGELFYSVDSGSTWSSDSLFTNLTPGKYVIQVKDERNCFSEQEPQLSIEEPLPLIIDTIIAYDVRCYGAQDGHIAIIARGGSEPLYYSLDSIHFQTQKDFYDLDTGIYIGYVVDAHGCSAVDTSRYISQPPNYAEFTVDTSQGCAPLQINFYPVRPDNTTFSWEFGDLTSSNQTNPVHIFHNHSGSPITYTVSVNAYHNLCTDTASMPIIVYPQPELNIEIDSVVSFYPDTIVEFTNNSALYYDYTWDYGDGTVEHIVHPLIHAYPGCGEYNLMVSARNAYYCYDTLETTINITAFTPTPSFIMSDNDGCAPLNVDFYNTTTDAQSYIWDFGDNTDTTTETNPTHTFLEGGTYMVTLTAIGYCDKQAKTAQPVYVYPNPSVDFEIQPDTVSVEQLAAFINNTIGGDYYEWDFGDGETSTEENPRRAYKQAGIYDVKLTAISVNGCKDSLIKEHAIVVISDLFIQFPTAFTPDGDGKNDYFTPLMNFVKYAELSIYDRYGNLIFHTKHPETEFWDGTLPNGKPVPSDVYVWRITGMFINGQQFEKHGEVTVLR